MGGGSVDLSELLAGQLTEPKLERVVRRALRQDRPAALAAFRQAALRDPNAADTIFYVLRNDKDDAVTRLMVEAATEAKNGRTRCNALDKLAGRHGEDVDDVLLQSCRADTWTVRLAAIAALNARTRKKSAPLRNEPRLVEALLAALTEPRVRAYTLSLLARCPPASALPEIVALVDHRDDDVVHAAIDALASIGDPAAEPILEAKLASVQADHKRKQIQGALRRLRRNAKRRTTQPPSSE